MQLPIPLPPTHPLRLRCHRLSQYYNGITYLVGSQVNPTNPTPRDVDIITVIPDSEFERRYGGSIQDWDVQTRGLGGVLSERWTIDMNKRSRSILVPGTVVDYKVVPMREFMRMAKLHSAVPPVQCDNRPPVRWDTINISLPLLLGYWDSEDI